MRLLAFGAWLCATSVAAEPPRLALPVDCALGDGCFIQNYVDTDPGPGARDFTCGPLSYDGHKGTDFALPTLAEMHAGVQVLAAAPGTVLAARDGMPDIKAGSPGAPDITGRDCGNGLVIDHGDGWQTQYCHMRQDSLRVEPGQWVDTGAVLGLVGLSGRTEFPHLHLSLRQNGAIVDPFHPQDAASCGAPAETLWSGPVGYTAGGLVAAGFSAALPEFDTIRAGAAAAPEIAATDAALVLWGFVFGGRAGDVMIFDIDGPGGNFLDQSVELTKTQAQLYRAVGKRRRASPWPAGDYTGSIALMRDGAPVDRQDVRMRVTD